MGKKNKKSFYKRSLKPFLNSNKVLLAAIGGTAAGLVMSSALGSDRAKQLLTAIENSFADFNKKAIPEGRPA